jgi:hypothetical protein
VIGALHDLAWRLMSLGLPELPPGEWVGWLRKGRVLERDVAGETALLLPDGTVVKLFRLKRLVSSAVVRPPARRFARNARRLRELGIRTVEVTGSYRLEEPRRHVVTYAWIDGTPLREAVRDPEARAGLVTRFARFLAQIHDRGACFRSLHFGNVLVQPDGGFALLDVADLSLAPGVLPSGRRLRNLRHLGRYAPDVAALRAHGPEAFVDEYLAATVAAASLGPTFRARAVRVLGGLVPTRAT